MPPSEELEPESSSPWSTSHCSGRPGLRRGAMGKSGNKGLRSSQTARETQGVLKLMNGLNSVSISHCHFNFCKFFPKQNQLQMKMLQENFLTFNFVQCNNSKIIKCYLWGQSPCSWSLRWSTTPLSWRACGLGGPAERRPLRVPCMREEAGRSRRSRRW